jgi:mRNA-degrading endonuclease RelE of RelBE toxin-antitoxin system
LAASRDRTGGWELSFERAAAEALADDMPGRDATLLAAALRRVAEAPFARHAKVTAMQGVANVYRLRQGDWRAIFYIDRARRQVVVTRVAHRREVYR